MIGYQLAQQLQPSHVHWWATCLGTDTLKPLVLLLCRIHIKFARAFTLIWWYFSSKREEEIVCFLTDCSDPGLKTFVWLWVLFMLCDCIAYHWLFIYLPSTVACKSSLWLSVIRNQIFEAVWVLNTPKSTYLAIEMPRCLCKSTIVMVQRGRKWYGGSAAASGLWFYIPAVITS